MGRLRARSRTGHTRGGTCVATLDTTAPVGVQPVGTHTIGVANDGSAQATYTVTGTPSASRGTEPADGVPDPALASATGPDTVPLGTPDTAGPTATTAGSGGGVPSWLIALGVLLVAVGVGIFAFVVRQMRHPKPDIEEPWSAADLET